MTGAAQTFVFDWQGITLSVTYVADWLSGDVGGNYNIAHLERRSLKPERAPLPITETGYRSHFTQRAIIESHGGAEAFVRAWLDHAAQSPEWKAQQAAAAQFSLF